MAILAVEDDGPGIPPEDVGRIFEPFYRSEQVRRQGIPGVGLGLAVVQRIAAAFRGTVTVRSELGKGSRFEVRLPLVGAMAEPDASSNGGQLVLNPSGRAH
jgi:two-component system phosphate regulon sensor histidine kinase PhoR